MITFSTCLTIFGGVVVFLIVMAVLFRPKATLIFAAGMVTMLGILVACEAVSHIGDNANRTFEAVKAKIEAQQGR